MYIWIYPQKSCFLIFYRGGFPIKLVVRRTLLISPKKGNKRNLMDNKLNTTKIRKALQASRRYLQKRIKRIQEDILHYELANPDLDDLAQIYTLRQQNYFYIKESEEKLERIEKALKRLDQNIYGKCQKCGNDIPPERLELIPYVEMCVDCQERAESNL
jgi:DnaK suppressor protein